MRKIVSSKRRFMVLFNQPNLLQRSGRDGVLNLPLERRLFSFKGVLRDWGLESTILVISSRYNYYRLLGSFLVYNELSNQMSVESVELLKAVRNGGLLYMVEQMYLQAMPTPAWGFFDKKRKPHEVALSNEMANKCQYIHCTRKLCYNKVICIANTPKLVCFCTSQHLRR